jgi:hypothetical protein
VLRKLHIEHNLQFPPNIITVTKKRKKEDMQDTYHARNKKYIQHFGWKAPREATTWDTLVIQRLLKLIFKKLFVNMSAISF